MIINSDSINGSHIQNVEARYGPCYVLKSDIFIGQSIINYGEYSKEECEQLVSLANERRGLVIDVGANIGAISQAFIATGHQVIAFEPQREVFELLALNCPNGVLHNCALGAYNTIAKIPLLDYSLPNNYGEVTVGGSSGLDIVMKRLDDFCFEDVSLIKIDVEGYEEEVLRGAMDTVKRCKPILYLEADREDKVSGLRNLLTKMGYSIQPHEPPLFAKKNYFNNENNIWGRQFFSFNWICRKM